MCTVGPRTVGSLLLLVGVIVYLVSSSLIVDERGKVSSTREQRCERITHILYDVDDPEFGVSDFDIPWDPNSTECSRTLQGDDGCAISLSCEIDIPTKPGDVKGKCDKEFLRVTDGGSGFKLFCGKMKFTDLRANSGLRDLFLVFEMGVKKPKGDGKGGAKDREKEKKAHLKRLGRLMATREREYKGVKCVVKCQHGKSDPGGTRLPANMKRKIDPKCFCGLRNNDGDRIVGGEDAKLNEIPWQVAIVGPGTRKPNCGGALINNEFVLTAAHCFWFKKKEAKEIEVLAHAFVLDMTKRKGWSDTAKAGEEGSIAFSGADLKEVTDKDENTQRFAVIEVINHPLFDQDFDYDYSLLRLEKKVNFQNQKAPVAPVCLPPVDTWNSAAKGWEESKAMMEVSGWGLGDENAGGTTRVLQKLKIPYVPFKICVPSISKYNPTSRMLCAGYTDDTKKDSCTGDSGGPLTLPCPWSEKMHWIVGIVSFGQGCGMGLPGIYSRVTDAVQWILFHTEESQPSWCDEPYKKPKDPSAPPPTPAPKKKGR